MIFYNLTAIPDNALKAVINAARVEAGARSTGVAVRVAYGNGGGEASAGRWVRWGRGARRVRCSAWIKLRLAERMSNDPLVVAKWLYETAAHEWRHVRDVQDGSNRDWDHRPRWGNRPQERRALSTQREAMENIERHADAILALALAIEEHKQGRSTK